MPTLHLLVGLPGSGKTTWVADQNFDPATTIVTSSDSYVAKYAAEQNSTYDAVFKEYIKQAQAKMEADIMRAVWYEKNLVIDQTSLTAASRAEKMSKIPDTWTKIAVLIDWPSDPAEWERRLNSRPGKNIPPEVMARMRKTFELPTMSEGFAEIIFVK